VPDKNPEWYIGDTADGLIKVIEEHVALIVESNMKLAFKEFVEDLSLSIFSSDSGDDLEFVVGNCDGFFDEFEKTTPLVGLISEYFELRRGEPDAATTFDRLIDDILALRAEYEPARKAD